MKTAELSVVKGNAQNVCTQLLREKSAIEEVIGQVLEMGEEQDLWLYKRLSSVHTDLCRAINTLGVISLAVKLYTKEEK